MTRDDPLGVIDHEFETPDGAVLVVEANGESYLIDEQGRMFEDQSGEDR